MSHNFVIGLALFAAVTVLIRFAFMFWKWTACALLAFALLACCTVKAASLDSTAVDQPSQSTEINGAAPCSRPAFLLGDCSMSAADIYKADGYTFTAHPARDVPTGTRGPVLALIALLALTALLTAVVVMITRQNHRLIDRNLELAGQVAELRARLPNWRVMANIKNMSEHFGNDANGGYYALSVWFHEIIPATEFVQWALAERGRALREGARNELGRKTTRTA